MNLGIVRHAAAVAFLCAATPSSAADWSSCARDLESLRNRASGASSAAQEVDSKMGKLDAAVADYQNCRSLPALYDLAKDGCSMKKSDAVDAEKDYRSALSDLEFALRDVNARVQSVSNNCEMEMGTPTAATKYLNSLPPDLREKCSIYLHNTAHIPKEELIGLCQKQYSADLCSRCIP